LTCQPVTWTSSISNRSSCCFWGWSSWSITSRICRAKSVTRRRSNSWWISERITPRNSTLTGLRQDRILEEAAAAGTRDPMHLASMFGLHPNTAQRYADAVYGRHDLASGYAREE